MADTRTVASEIRKMIHECADDWANGSSYSRGHELCMHWLFGAHESACGRSVYGHSLAYVVDQMRQVATETCPEHQDTMMPYIKRIEALMASA